MGMITVIARKDLGYNHLYGEIRKGGEYVIDEEHFDPKLYRKKQVEVEVEEEEKPLPSPLPQPAIERSE